MSSLRTIGLRNLGERKGRSALTASGVALGVALFVGALIAAATTNHGIDRLATEASGQADVIVAPAGGVGASLLNPVQAAGLDETDVSRMVGMPDVRAAGGVVGFPTVFATSDGRSTDLALNQRTNQSSLVGLDLAADELFPVRLLDGRLPEPGAAEVALPADMAEDLGMSVGDGVSVSSPTGDRLLEAVGILDERGIGRLDTVGFTTSETARTLAGLAEDAVSFITLRLEDGQAPQAWIDRHEDSLGAGLTAVRATQVGDSFRAQLTMLSGSMTALAAAVLFSAGYLIYLTLSVTVVERTRLYGVLHALGATRRQVRRLVLVEALGMGATATVVGLGLGVLVAFVLNAATARFLSLVGNPPVQVPPWALLAGAAFGLGTTIVSALAPARRAAGVDPVSAIREVHAAPAPRPARWIGGAVLLALGLVLLGIGRGWAMQSLAVVAVLGGSIRLVGPTIAPLAGLVRRVVGRLSPGTGEIAVLHLAKEPTRSASTLALVMIVMALTFATGALTVSYVRSLEREIDRTFTNDVTLYAASTFDDEFIGAVGDHPAVAEASPLGRATTFLDDGDDDAFVYVDVIDPASYFEMAGFLWHDGDDDTVRTLLERGGGVILPVPLADRLDVGRGDHVVLDTAAGPATFEVAALARMSNIPPKLVVGAADGREHFGVTRPMALLVNVEPGTPVGEAAAALERDLGARATFLVATAGELRADARAQILGVSNGFFVLLFLAGLVGLVGLANTLAVSIIQRIREIGIIRAVGARRRQVGVMAVVEAMTMVSIAFLLAVPLGALISRPLMNATSAGIGDFEAPYVFPWLMIPVVAVIAAVVGGVAALWPARRATVTDIDVALRFE